MSIPSLLHSCFKSIAKDYLVGNAQVTQKNILPIELIECLLLNAKNYLKTDQLNNDAFIKVLQLSNLPSLSLSNWNITKIALNALDGNGLLAIRLDHCYHLEEEDIVALASRAPHLKTFVLLNLALSKDNFIKIISACPALTELKVKLKQSKTKILHELAKKCVNLEKLSIHLEFRLESRGGIVNEFALLENWNEEISSLSHFQKLSFFRLKFCEITLDSLIAHLPPKLTTLELCQCKEKSGTDKEILVSEKSKPISNLNSLAIEHCTFTQIPTLLLASSKLNHLTIRGSRIEESILNVVDGCKNLTHLELIFSVTNDIASPRQKKLLARCEEFKNKNKHITNIHLETMPNHDYIRNDSSGRDPQIISSGVTTDDELLDINVSLTVAIRVII